MMNNFVERIKKISTLQGNFIPLDQVLQLAAAHYYGQHDAIGSTADFITAPEISAVFGRCIAKYVEEGVLSDKDLVLIELGAGKGTLFRDMWSNLSNEMKCRVKKIIFIEMSEKMREVQNKIIDDLGLLQIFEHVKALEMLQIYENSEIVLIGNEFLDALPVKQYVKIANKVHELGVNNENSLVISRQGVNSDELLRVNSAFHHVIAKAKERDLIEISPARDYCMRQILNLLKDYRCGRALLIDYGYIDSPFCSTIQAVKHHMRVKDFISHLGEADISSLVDFYNLLQIADGYSGAGGITSEVVTQEDFLISLGIGDMLEEKIDAHAAKRLLIDMGELFKVMKIECSR